MSSFRFPALLFSFFVLMLAASGSARAGGDPVHLGPLDGDGQGILAHATDPNLLLAAHLFPTTMLRSTDGGASFIESHAGLPTGSGSFAGLGALTQDPKDADTVYVLAGYQVHRTTDFGLSWTALPLMDFDLEQLLVSSVDDTILARTDSQLYRSTDAGATWQVVATGTNLFAATMCAADPSRVYYGAAGGVFRSDDGGATFAPTSFTVLPYALAVSPVDPDLVLVGVNQSITAFLWRSTDGMASSQFVTSLGIALFPDLLAWNPADPTEVWATTTLNTPTVHRSLDGGLSFAPVQIGAAGAPAPTQFSYEPDGDLLLSARGGNSGLWRLPVGGSDWEKIGFDFVSVRDVAVVGSRRAAVTSDGLFVLAPDEQVSIPTYFTGFSVGPNCVTADPVNPEHWLAGGALADLFEDSAIMDIASDGTASLAYVGYIDGAVEDIEFVSSAPGVVVAGKTSNGFPNPLLRSTDNGDTWQDVPGVASLNVRDLAVDPHTPGRIAAIDRDAAVAESLDAGATWSAPATWIPDVDDGVLLGFDPHRSGTVFLGSSSSGLWRSLNAGLSWQNLGVGLRTTSELVFSNSIPGLLWLTDEAGAVLVSADRGNSFEVAFQPGAGTTASPLALDPVHNSLLVGTSNHGLYELAEISPYEVLGGGTPGSDGFVPRVLPLLTQPQVGNTSWGLRGTQAVGGGLAVFALGLTDFELPIYGGAWHVFPPVFFTLALPLGGTAGIGGAGSFALPIPIPPDPSLSAVRLIAQYLVVGDPSAADPSGFVLSDALATVIQP